MSKKFLVWVISAFLIFGFAFAGEKIGFKPLNVPPGVQVVNNEIVVELNSPASIHLPAIAKAYGLRVKRFLKHARNYGVLKVPPGRDINAVLERLRKNPRVKAADLNTKCYAFFIPNDPYYSYQWNFQRLNMETAWDISTGNNVVVAVVDTGIAYEDYGSYALAPDLAGTKFTNGYDFVNNDSHPNDDEGHGTHVAGTIAQTTNNNEGVAGIAFNAVLMPVKVLDSSGSGQLDWLIDGIKYAADHGAQVINMSLGWPRDYNPGETLHDAVKYAYNKGVVLVAASGNDSYRAVSYPAAYPEVISVGATNSADERARYSNYGENLELVAPGGDSKDRNGDGYMDGILQQTFGDTPTDFGYYFYTGTSMATPHVTATVALLIAKGITGVENIRQILHDTAIDLGKAGWDKYYGYGLVNPVDALNYSGTTNPTKMYVASIDMNIAARGPFKTGVAKVLILDESGSPVANAVVTGHWSGLTSDTDSVTTDENGYATIKSDKIKASSGIFTFTVDNVQKEGYEYDPSMNLETSDSISL